MIGSGNPAGVPASLFCLEAFYVTTDAGRSSIRPMNTARQLLAAVAALPLSKPVRVLNLCGDQERVISLSGMRRALPDNVRLLSGPGCAASVCPEPDLYQVIRLAMLHPVTVLAAENMLQLPLGRQVPGPRCLREAGLEGADVRTVSAPVEAVLAARAEPQREMVFFAAGFETLLAPLAGMVLEGLPENLSILLCGRRVEFLLERLLAQADPGFDALLLPGNRCAITGTGAWDGLVHRHHVPAAVAGYDCTSVLAAVHAVVRQHCAGEARVENYYRGMARPEGNAMALDQLYRVFDIVDGDWRGVGRVRQTAFRLRHAYGVVDADGRYPDYRGDLRAADNEMPAGCECAAVVLGQMDPTDCRQFCVGCTAGIPYGPCMASEDGACFVRSADRRAA